MNQIEAILTIWNNEYSPRRPVSMSPREAAIDILSTLDWRETVEEYSYEELLPALETYALYGYASDLRFGSGYMNKLNRRLLALVTSSMARSRVCVAHEYEGAYGSCPVEDGEHDFQEVWFIDMFIDEFMDKIFDSLKKDLV